MGSLDGQVVLVTGATDGLGSALAVSLAEAGATVLVHGRVIATGPPDLIRNDREVQRAYLGDGELDAMPA